MKIKRKTKNKVSLEEVLERFKSIHGDRYLYGKVVLGNTLKDKVIVICRKHGSFLQIPGDHIYKKAN